MPTINQLSATESPQGGDLLPIYSGSNGDTRKLSFGRLATWMATALSNVIFTGYMRVTPVTVANLPSAAASGAGARAFVTDANGNNFHTVVASGGSNLVPVYSDGTQWRIG